MMADDNKMAIADAVQAMWEACEKKDWEGAATAFSDAQRLSDDDSSEEAEGGEKGDDGKKKPAIALIFGEKKK